MLVIKVAVLAILNVVLQQNAVLHVITLSQSLMRMTSFLLWRLLQHAGLCVTVKLNQCIVLSGYYLVTTSYSIL